MNPLEGRRFVWKVRLYFLQKKDEISLLFYNALCYNLNGVLRVKMLLR